MLRRFFSSPRSAARGQPGWRAYVIGDVHGRLDLLDRLLADIRSDHEARPAAMGLIVLLGDLIDRGPDSAGVLDRLSGLDWAGFRFVGLAGNHEEILLELLAGDGRQLSGWLRFGGVQTMQSYGVDGEALATMEPEAARRRIADAVPGSHRDYLASLGDSLRFGDYLFVHAGIRPGVPLEQQTLQDLRWIREPFLSDSRDHGMVVVHGHTISERVEELGSRIGIDTGAYATGRLTAIGIEDDRRWLIDTVDGLQAREATLV
jgi:serine/threonine protein phosphatase 1